jgi:hypothetical protein
MSERYKCLSRYCSRARYALYIVVICNTEFVVSSWKPARVRNSCFRHLHSRFSSLFFISGSPVRLLKGSCSLTSTSEEFPQNSAVSNLFSSVFLIILLGTSLSILLCPSHRSACEILLPHSFILGRSSCTEIFIYTFRTHSCSLIVSVVAAYSFPPVFRVNSLEGIFCSGQNTHIVSIPHIT